MWSGFEADHQVSTLRTSYICAPTSPVYFHGLQRGSFSLFVSDLGCNVVESRRNVRFSKEHTGYVFYPEDGDDRFLLGIGKSTPENTILPYRSQHSSQTPRSSSDV